MDSYVTSKSQDEEVVRRTYSDIMNNVQNDELFAVLEYNYSGTSSTSKEILLKIDNTVL